MDAAHTNDVIAAIATAAGAAGVCVVRMSGAGALSLGDRLVRGLKSPPSHRAGGTFFHADLIHPHSGARIDDVVMLVYRAPHSYTGEDTLEIQGHGGPVLPRLLLEAVLAAGARLAEPGEFTKRAFLNGRMDLTQAEAVCDLIQARTERAALAARAQLNGALGRRVGALYEQVTDFCAEVEHLLDFDDSELPDGFMDGAQGRLDEIKRELAALIGTWREGHLLREGALVVISGRPNAGKSSLLNALLGKERAIVHHEPGTTRDVIEEGCAIGGVPLRLVDTAGLRESQDAVESEGVARARALMRQADINLRVVDLTADDAEEALGELVEFDRDRTLVGLSKCDLPWAYSAALPDGWQAVRFSAKTGVGLDDVRQALLARLGMSGESAGEAFASQRHIAELRTAVAQVQAAGEALSGGGERLVLAANHLRETAEALGRIVGRVYTADLLDAIFRRFCVGK